MIRQPRRGMSRMIVVNPFEEQDPVEIRPAARRGAHILGALLLLFLVIEFVPGLFEEDTQGGGSGNHRRSAKGHRGKGRGSKAVAPIPVWKRFGSGVGARGATADPVAKKKTYEVLTKMAAFLPLLAKEKTNPNNFKERLERLLIFIAKLPPSTRRSLYRGVTLEKFMKVYESSPERACKLLDRMYAQCRIILS